MGAAAASSAARAAAGALAAAAAEAQGALLCGTRGHLRAYAWCCDSQPAMTLKPELASDCTASALPGSAAAAPSSARNATHANPSSATRPAATQSLRRDPAAAGGLRSRGEDERTHTGENTAHTAVRRRPRRARPRGRRACSRLCPAPSVLPLTGRDGWRPSWRPRPAPSLLAENTF